MIEIRKDLLIGDTRPYVLWRRVSTEEQGKSGLGLDAQLHWALAFMGREPVNVFTDVYSGTKLKECMGLWSAIDECKKNNYLLLVAKTDRFRNAKEALEVLDAVGEHNIAFCDMPTVDRMILTIMFSVWERQAYMGRINTKLALERRKATAEKEGGWISKTGRWTTGFGGFRYSSKEQFRVCQQKGADKKKDERKEWCENSKGFKWVEVQFYKGTPKDAIIREFNVYHDMGMVGFSTRSGEKLSPSILRRWIRYIKDDD